MTNEELRTLMQKLDSLCRRVSALEHKVDSLRTHYARLKLVGVALVSGLIGAGATNLQQVIRFIALY